MWVRFWYIWLVTGKGFMVFYDMTMGTCVEEKKEVGPLG